MPKPASIPRSPRSRTPPDAAFWSSSGVQVVEELKQKEKLDGRKKRE
jgi:hypothetical protein